MTNFEITDLGDDVAELTMTADRLAMPDLHGIADLLGTLSAGVLLIRSDQADFCLGRAHEASGPRTPDQVRDDVLGPISRLYAAVRDASFPVISVVQGRALGLGFALATSSDMIVASSDATFGMPEIKAGFPPLLAVAQLFDVIPRHMAFHLGVSAEPIGASQFAASLGLPLIVEDRAELDRMARSYARKITGFAHSASGLKSFLRERSSQAYSEATASAIDVLAEVQSALSRR